MTHITCSESERCPIPLRARVISYLLPRSCSHWHPT